MLVSKPSRKSAFKQNTLTFRVDVDGDGKSPDDLETTIANVKEYVPFLNDKNAQLFFTGEAFFKQIRLQSRN
jgi:hypothetical protein